MTVSVALCTYNGQRWLAPFLDSLATQTRLPDELVVSDDGSSDATLELIAAFSARAPFPVRLSSTPQRLGSTLNFERAFRACVGEIIAPADQDDLWAPEKLERLTRVLAEHGADMVFSDGRVIDERGDLVDRTLWEGVGFDRRDQRRFARDPLSVLIRRSVVTGAAMAFRAERLDWVVPFPESLNDPGSLMLQDRWIALVLAARGVVTAVPEPLISFRVHPAQQTGLRGSSSGAEAGHQLRRPIATTADAFKARADQLKAVVGRLDGGGRSGADRRLRAAEAHLRMRAALPPRRPRRLRTVAGQALTLKYHRYSGGARSAVADLLRPA